MVSDDLEGLGSQENELVRCVSARFGFAAVVVSTVAS